MRKKQKVTIKRMDKPDDTLVKRQATYAGDVMHKFLEFPGDYAGPCMNEYPNVEGGVPRTDSTYYVNYLGKLCVMNWEDESTKVDESTYEKLNYYRINLEYFFKTDVISAITTILPLEKCIVDFKSSPTLPFKPILIPYPEWDGSKRLSTITAKINNNEILTKVEAMNLVMLPKMFTSNQEIILEKVCKLLPQAKIEDADFKLELVFEMRCVIHKYAKTLEDIVRLEGVIGLQEAVTAKQFQDQKLIDQGYDQGYGQGYGQGAFELALKFKKIIGIEKIVENTDFTKEELENEKLNR